MGKNTYVVPAVFRIILGTRHVSHEKTGKAPAPVGLPAIVGPLPLWGSLLSWGSLAGGRRETVA